MAVDLAETSDDIDMLAERGDMIGRCKHASGEQFAVLVAGRDHVFLWSLVHRQDVLVFSR